MKSILLLGLPLALADSSQQPIVDTDPIAWALPRGVSPALLEKFRPSPDHHFTCISPPSQKIPYSLVNDDFCDCPDGSDEPGTAACSHLNHSTNPLPGFFCPNRGHVPAYIPFSRINDGICDYDVCCDGSDEWMGVGGVKCEDHCDAIGKEARIAQAEAKRLYESGLKAYRSLVAKAALLKKESEDKIAVLDGEIIHDEAILETKRRELSEAEAEEKSKVSSHTDGKGRHAQLLQFSKDRITELKDKMERLRNEKMALQEDLESAEKILSTFKEEYNPNFNDEGVKRAVKAWEDYLASKDTPPEDASTFMADMETLLYDEPAWEEWEPVPDPFVEDMYAIESLLPPFLRSWVHGQISAAQSWLVENGLLAHRKTSSSPSSENSSTSPRVQKLQDEVNDADSKLQNKKSDRDNLKEDVKKDYGTSDVFRALKDVCTEGQSGEYTYSFCHLGRATQKNRDGGHTHLGDWVGFEKRMDDEIEEEVTVVKFENGLRCWNGPERSAYVYLRCSAEEKVLSVAETEKCVYKFVATTPAVCGGKGKDGEAAEAVVETKDEVWGS
ncbi:hypothetical protein ABW20_dc0101193 [Dactylellina cionopaga]|nr:hypothetical protein ABW20_dc0101193 [Dactylellina cionopaga]